MGTSRTIRGLVFSAIVLALSQGCGGSGPPNGELLCGAGPKPCPDDYYCNKTANTCWLNGTGPDAAITPDAPGSTSPDSGDAAPLDVGNPLDVGKPHDTGPAVDGLLPDVPKDAPIPQTDTDLPKTDADLSKKDTGLPDSPPDSSQCPSGKVPCGTKCIDSTACCTATDCTGACMTCDSTNACVALKSQDDLTGRCAGTCDATGACKSKPGQTCSLVGGGCASGTSCSPEGICCDKPCTGSCEACDATGACKPLAANATPKPGHAACIATDPTCAGKCDGTSAACTYSTIACGTATCTSSVFQPAGTCNTGACVKPPTQTCANACVVASGGCTGVCTPAAIQCSAQGVPQKCSAAGAWQDQTACGPGFTCSTGACVCASPKTNCTSACVDLQTDSANCGTCGHNCQGGSCVLGQCQPVVVVGNLGAAGAQVFALEGSYLYYNDFGPAVPGAPVSSNRILKTATNGTGTQIDDRQGGGVVGSLLLSWPDRFGFCYDCNVSSCSTTRVELPTGHRTVRLTSPASSYFAMTSNDEYSLFINWYNASNAVATTYTEYPASTDVDQGFIGYGTFVYWVRDLYNGSGGSYSSSVLYGVNSSTGARAQLAGNITTAALVPMDANAQSVLLSDPIGTKNLYRVPLPIGKGSAAPDLLVSGADPWAAIEDANNVYWIDSGGTLYKCAATNCAATKTIITNGQQNVSRLYQDATYLYWGTSGPSQVVRLAK